MTAIFGTMAISFSAGFVLIVAATTLSTPALAASTPIDTVLSALKKEETAPIERVRLFTQYGSVSDLWYIDKVRPDRTHALKNPQAGGMETIVIGKTQWVRSDDDWTQSPITTETNTRMPSVNDLLRQGLSEATEKAEAGGGRVVAGKMAWDLGSRCEGQLTFHIAKTGLPSFMEFVGACAGAAAHFNQAYSFAGPLKIEAPQ